MERVLVADLNIDGSKLLNSNFYTLRATLQLQGRGITVYETIYPIKNPAHWRGKHKPTQGGCGLNVPPQEGDSAEHRVP